MLLIFSSRPSASSYVLGTSKPFLYIGAVFNDWSFTLFTKRVCVCKYLFMLIYQLDLFSSCISSNHSRVRKYICGHWIIFFNFLQYLCSDLLPILPFKHNIGSVFIIVRKIGKEFLDEIQCLGTTIPPHSFYP